MNRQQIILLHRDAPSKPPAGAPCNGCGVCCAAETCPAARLLFRSRRGPCRALEWSEDSRRYHCGLLTRPRQLLPRLPARCEKLAIRLFARWIAAGKSCDSDATVAGA